MSKRMEKMQKIVKYYLGDSADKVYADVLKELADKLYEAGYNYWCFWAFLMRNYEAYKAVYKDFLLSDPVWNAFLEDRRTAKDRMSVKCGVQIDKFKTESRFYGVDQVVLLDKIRVMPLIKYTMGMYYEVPFDYCVRHQEQAKQQLREEPDLFELLEKLEAFFPITKKEVMESE